MIRRKKQSDIQRALNHVPAVAILGPRQIGKTTLAKTLIQSDAAHYLDLENPTDAQKLSQPLLYFRQFVGQLIIIDEIQRQPNLFSVLRSQIDQNREVGHATNQFLLLGSASNELLNQSAESLAGRISYQTLSGFNLSEVGSKNQTSLWMQGGFPQSYQDKEFSFQWRQDFIRTYLERDIPQLGSRIPAATLRRFWIMLAHNQGQLFQASQIGANLGVSGQAASRYLDLMTDLMLVRRLQPWRSNIGKRLVKTPKTFVRDSGILHALLGIESFDQLMGHPVFGASWEGFVLENILSVVPEHVQRYFYRTSAGAEIDLVLEHRGQIWAIEMKASLTPKVTKGFYFACDDIKADQRLIVYPGNESYPLNETTWVVSLSDILERLQAV